LKKKINKNYDDFKKTLKIEVSEEEIQESIKTREEIAERHGYRRRRKLNEIRRKYC